MGGTGKGRSARGPERNTTIKVPQALMAVANDGGGGLFLSTDAGGEPLCLTAPRVRFGWSSGSNVTSFA